MNCESQPSTTKQVRVYVLNVLVISSRVQGQFIGRSSSFRLVACGPVVLQVQITFMLRGRGRSFRESKAGWAHGERTEEVVTKTHAMKKTR